MTRIKIIVAIRDILACFYHKGCTYTFLKDVYIDLLMVINFYRYNISHEPNASVLLSMDVRILIWVCLDSLVFLCCVQLAIYLTFRTLY